MFLAAAITAAACAGARPSAAPLRYPALPPPGSAARDVTASAFTPAATLSPYVPNCRPEEPALANALDDDCDGRIDGRDDAPAIVIAYPREAPVTIALRDEKRGERAIAPPACAADSAFCSLRLSASELAGGPYTLLARRSPDSATRGSLVVSVQTRGAASAYIAPPSPPEQPEQLLGHTALP